MRGISCLIALIAAGSAFAQITPDFSKVDFKKAISQDPVAPPITTQPVQSEGFELISAEFSEINGDDIRLKGDVRFKYKGFTVHSDEVVGNFKTQLFHAYGSVTVTSDELSYEGGSVDIDTENRVLGFRQARTTLKPSFLHGQTTADVYIRAGQGYGTAERYTLENGAFTTCDLSKPHWELSAQNMVILANRAIIMRNTTLKILGRTVLGLPYLSIPLDADAPKYLPEIGQSQDEGLFVKARLGIGLSGKDLLDVRTDLMTKKGIGLGSDYDYSAKNKIGKLSIYNLIGPDKTLLVNLNHTQDWRNVKLSSQIDYSRHSYLSSPQTTSLSLRNSISFGQGLRFSQLRNSSQSTGFRTTNDTFSMNVDRSMGKTRFNGDFTLTRNNSSGSGFSVKRQVFDVRTTTSHNFNEFDAALTYNRSIPVGTVTGFFSDTDRTPVFELRSDTRRLFRMGIAAPLDFSVGEFVDSIKRSPLSRMSFHLNLPQQSLPKRLGNGPLSLIYGADFLQNLYSDDTAQFVTSYNTALRYQVANKVTANLRYGFLRAQGYAPLSIDRRGRNDAAGFDLEVRPTKRITTALTTGYDFVDRPGKQTPWQTVGVRGELKFNERNFVKAYSSYDTIRHAWSQTRLDYGVTVQGASFIGGVRYDGLRHTFAGIDLAGQNMRWGRLTSGFLLSFNGYTKRFESKQLDLTYDLHCAEAVLSIQDNRTGFRNGTQVQFFIRLKAIPFSSNFGSGTKGQVPWRSGGYGF